MCDCEGRNEGMDERELVPGDEGGPARPTDEPEQWLNQYQTHAMLQILRRSATKRTRQERFRDDASERKKEQLTVNDS